ncbi:MAG: TIGR01906 family membrane protein [Chloroflexi bacterium]|nr:TIGR01906 family membrane protein [Chloroflexota bacterium]
MNIIAKTIHALPTTFFTAAFLTLLVASNVRLAFNSLSFYEWEFQRQGVEKTTGLTLEQLSEAGQQIRDYFNSHQEPLDVTLVIASETIYLFSEREVIHMADVKQLVQRVYRIQEGAFLLLFLWITLGFFVQGNEFISRTRSLFLQASAFTMVTIAAVGLLAAIAFQPLFTLFHRLSFSNDFWILDPRTSYLLQMFPFQFWLEATILIGAATIAEALAVAILLTVLGWLREWRVRAAQSKLPQFT